MTDKSELIIQAALKIFYQRGYGPITVEDIAREAKVAKGTIYLYFKDKDELFYRSVLYVIEFIEATTKEVAADSKDPFQVLGRIAYAQLYSILQNKHFCGLFYIISNPGLVSNREKLFKILLEKENSLLSFITRIIEQGKSAGFIEGSLDAKEVAYLFQGMFSNTLKRIHHEPPEDTIDIDKTVTSLIDVLKNGIHKRG